MAKRDEPGWGRSTIDMHRFLFEYGFTDESFLLEHTHGAEQLRARAAETDLGGSACFNDARVEMTRLVTAELESRNIAVWTAPMPSEQVH